MINQSFCASCSPSPEPASSLQLQNASRRLTRPQDRNETAMRAHALRQGAIMAPRNCDVADDESDESDYLDDVLDLGASWPPPNAPSPRRGPLQGGARRSPAAQRKSVVCATPSSGCRWCRSCLGRGRTRLLPRLSPSSSSVAPPRLFFLHFFLPSPAPSSTPHRPASRPSPGPPSGTPPLPRRPRRSPSPTPSLS